MEWLPLQHLHRRTSRPDVDLHENIHKFYSLDASWSSRLLGTEKKHLRHEFYSNTLWNETKRIQCNSFYFYNHSNICMHETIARCLISQISQDLQYIFRPLQSLLRIFTYFYKQRFQIPQTFLTDHAKILLP